MSSLNRNLTLGYPISWVTTSEPDRVIDSIVHLSDQAVYLHDAIDGLLLWQRNDWRNVLDIDENGEDVIIQAFPHALSFVLKNKGILIIRHAHKVVENFLDLLSSLAFKQRNAFCTDDADKLPAQVVLLSNEAEVPAEIASVTAHTGSGYMSESEIAATITYIVAQAGDKVLVSEKDLPKLVRAGAGLTEFELIQTALNSIVDTGHLNPEYIDRERFAKLKASTSLNISKPTITLNDIGGLNRVKELVTQAQWILNNPEEAASFGLDPIRRILLIGIPGTGKSAICEAFASAMNLELVKTGVSKAMNRFVGESERNMRQMFAQVAAVAPVAVWIDELGRDLSGGDSSSYVDGGTTSRVHGEFLTGMQELPDNVFLVAAANNIDSLAPEMLRADRFDKIMFVGYPSFQERIEIFSIHLRGLSGTFDLEALAKVSPTFTGAEIKDLIKSTKSSVSAVQRRAITTADLITQMPKQKNLIWIKRRSMVQSMYVRAMDEFEWASDQQHSEAQRYIDGKLDIPQSRLAGSAIKY